MTYSLPIALPIDPVYNQSAGGEEVEHVIVIKKLNYLGVTVTKMINYCKHIYIANKTWQRVHGLVLRKSFKFRVA